MQSLHHQSVYQFSSHSYVISNASKALIVELQESASEVHTAKTVRVTSDDDVDVYAYSVYQNPDARPSFSFVNGIVFSPVSEKDTHYIVTLIPSTLKDSRLQGSFFVMTATRDNTNVNLTYSRRLSLRLETHAIPGNGAIRTCKWGHCCCRENQVERRADDGDGYFLRGHNTGGDQV